MTTTSGTESPQRRSVARAFARHRLAQIGGFALVIMYLTAICADYLAPYAPTTRFASSANAPTQGIHVLHEGKLTWPYAYAYDVTRDPDTLALRYERVEDIRRPVQLNARGEPYRALGFIPTDRHLFGVDDGQLHLFGTDELGRDIFSRTLHGARLSLSVGLVGVVLSLLLGLTIGALAGYFGGLLDSAAQRVTEFLLSLPTIPLWMGLAAALPAHWTVVQLYFAITIILSLTTWLSMARVIRGLVLSLRESEFVLAAKAIGASDVRVIMRHLLPNCASYIVVHVTLAIPAMILGETALSFLGLGLRPPAVSWGVLLQDAQNVRAIASYPWQFIPVLFVVVTVLAFNFVGDGLRDAADPNRA